MSENRPVVIALDGGLHSTTTLDWGLAEADLRGADVMLVRTWQDPVEATAWGWYPMTGDWGYAEEAERYLKAQQERASSELPGRTVTVRALYGPEVPALRDVAADAQLLVVGSCSVEDGGRLGRVASHLAAHAAAPVAVVRAPQASPSSPVVVGVDGSQVSFDAVRVAAREAALRGVPLVLLHARRTVPDPYGTRTVPAATLAPDDPLHTAAGALADEVRAEHPGLTVEVEIVEDDPAHALIERSHSARLVVVGTRGFGAFRGMLLGSVSHDVLRRATCTVLVAREAR